MLKEDGWDDESQIEKKSNVEHVWLHFGFITNDDGEKDSGWKVLSEEPKNRQGCIKATMVK